MRIASTFLAAAVLMATPAIADDTSDFQARYATLKAAMDEREEKDIKALLTKDFTATDIQGDVRDADDMITELAMIPVMPDMKRETKLLSVAVSGASASIVQTLNVQMSRQGRDGATHQVEMINQANDTWVQIGGKWLLKTTETQDLTIKRDGIEVRHFHKGDKIPPRPGRPQ